MSKKRDEILKRTKITVVPAREINDKFTMVSNAAITLLDSKSFHVYCYMLKLCDMSNRCYPSYDDINAKLGLNRNTISNCIKFLSEIGLIDVKKRKSGSTYNNVYVVYGIKDVAEITEKDGLIIEKKIDDQEDEELDDKIINLEEII